MKVSGTAVLCVVEGGGEDLSGSRFVTHGASVVAGVMCMTITLESRGKAGRVKVR